MSKEISCQFLDQVGSNEEFRAQIENQVDSDGNISIDVLIALEVEIGCECDAEDLEEWSNEWFSGDGVVAAYDDGRIQINLSSRWKDVNIRCKKDRIGICNDEFEYSTCSNVPSRKPSVCPRFILPRASGGR